MSEDEQAAPVAEADDVAGSGPEEPVAETEAPADDQAEAAAPDEPAAEADEPVEMEAPEEPAAEADEPVEMEAPEEPAAEADEPVEMEAPEEPADEPEPAAEVQAPVEAEAPPQTSADAEAPAADGDSGSGEEEQSIDPEVAEFIRQDTTVVAEGIASGPVPSEFRTPPGIPSGLDPGRPEDRDRVPGSG